MTVAVLDDTHHSENEKINDNPRINLSVLCAKSLSDLFYIILYVESRIQDVN